MSPNQPYLRKGIYRGWVRHRRMLPKNHEFRYPLAMVLFDLDSVEQDVAQSRWWSLERFNLISFYRKDYINADKLKNLPLSVKEKIKEETGECFNGGILLLTHPRYFGWVMNPVSFYFCYGDDGLQFIVAEINNTPWDERFSYVLDCRSQKSNTACEFKFDKDFHVSPFMPMDLAYHWRFSFKGDALNIHMNLLRAGEKVFDATMKGEHQPFSAQSMRRLPIDYPLQTIMVGVRIYWNALLLWLKGVQFFSHPDSTLKSKQKTGEG